MYVPLTTEDGDNADGGGAEQLLVLSLDLVAVLVTEVTSSTKDSDVDWCKKSRAMQYVPKLRVESQYLGLLEKSFQNDLALSRPVWKLFEMLTVREKRRTSCRPPWHGPRAPRPPSR